MVAVVVMVVVMVIVNERVRTHRDTHLQSQWLSGLECLFGKDGQQLRSIVCCMCENGTKNKCKRLVKMMMIIIMPIMMMVNRGPSFSFRRIQACSLKIKIN